MSATKNRLINVVIMLLVLASLLLLCKPCYFTENDSASVMSYIVNPTHHDEITGLMEDAYPGFILNGQVWMPILLFLLGAVSIFMMIWKRGLTSSLLWPIAYSLFGILTVWTNQLTRLGGVTWLPSLVMLITLILCLYNGVWTFGDAVGSFKPDPQAKSKLKEIERAVARKKIETLKTYAQSTDITVRTAAIAGIAKVGGKEAFQPLVAQMSCAEPEVRIAAAKALGELGDQRGRTHLLHFMEYDKDSRVRSAMREALRQLPSLGE